MPHSLRARLGNLRYKGIITDKDYDRLCKALDNENTLDKIRAEIQSIYVGYRHGYEIMSDVLDIFNKYRGGNI